MSLTAFQFIDKTSCAQALYPEKTILINILDMKITDEA